MTTELTTSSLLAEMTRLAPLPMLAVEPDSGTIVALNQLARDTLGWQSSGSSLRELFESPSLARQFLLMARNNGFIRQYEARLRLVGGQLVWMLISARLVEWADETLLVVSLIDVHERHLVEDALRDSEARHRRVLEMANEGYALFDASTAELLDVNPALCDLLGYSREEMLLLTPGQVLPEESLTRLIDEQRRWGSMPHHRFELGLRRANGERITAEISVSGIADQDGRLHSIFALVSDITARKRNEERVLYLAFYDTLTALPNRFLFAEHIEQALRQQQRRGDVLALMFIDLDDFKQVNDNYGHDAGDELLRVVAKRLVACVRASDTVSRQGGDEFMVLLGNLTDRHAAIQVAEKMLASLAEPVELDGQQLRVRASIGIAICPEHGDNTASLRRHADIAMYQAKFGGKHRYAIYSDDAPD
ncbi:diguanylate cyclase domain-containing protein [Chitinimonas sp.]|uniref:diguanylate cyclase domain-containing protein n=1 Tax=Chitinimonas sp. TaxID=1934313 RepID=UPI0035B02A39